MRPEKGRRYNIRHPHANQAGKRRMYSTETLIRQKRREVSKSSGFCRWEIGLHRPLDPFDGVVGRRRQL
jgi:hypothetical protein